MRKEGYGKWRIGEEHVTNEGYVIKIIDYKNSSDCTVQFEDNYKTIMYNQQYWAVVDGRVKNPNHPVVCGIGYFGQGRYKALTVSGRTKHYLIWYLIISRCYNKKHLERNPTYKGCSIDSRWYNFQVFAQWFEDNYVEGWQLDKDILIKGNKIYSPETCVFVPQEINKLFTRTDAKRGKYPIGVTYHKRDKMYTSRVQKEGKLKHLGYFSSPEEAFEAYKTAKESYIKEIADKWKGLISDRVYQAMYRYEVEITD